MGALHALVREVFHADDASARALSGRLHSWTRGNPFFVEELLKALVSSGALFQRGGAWHGWDADPPGLPRSIRDADRRARRPARSPSRDVANLAAVVGTRTSHDVLVAVSGRAEHERARGAGRAARAWRAHRGRGAGGGIRYEFTPSSRARRALRRASGSRARGCCTPPWPKRSRCCTVPMPARTPTSWRTTSRGPSRAGSPARRCATSPPPDAAPRARYANREAADYLGAALAQHRSRRPGIRRHRRGVDRRRRPGGGPRASAPATRRLRRGDLALDDGRAPRRGEPATTAAWPPSSDGMGLGSYWSGRYRDALAHFDVALEAATAPATTRCSPACASPGR